MKDKGIARDVGGRIKRAAGDAPSLGNIGRVARTSEHSGSGRRRRRVTDEERALHHHKKGTKNSRTVTLAWTLTLVVVAIALLAGFFFFWLKPFIERRDRMVEQSNRPAKLMPVEAPVVFQSIGEREAVELTKRALKSRNAEEIEKSMTLGETPASEAIAFLSNLRTSEGEIARYDWVTRLDTTRTDMEGVLVSFQKGENKTNRLAILSPDESGDWKMDFAAFARLTTPSWSELIDGKAESGVVRVYVATDSYFNGPFQDADGWRCFGLASPDLPDLIFGYCKADSAQARALSMLLMDNKKVSRATVEIGKVSGGEKRQFQIKRVLAQDWAVGPTPFDEE